MNRNDIARSIANDLLINDALNESDFNFDTDAIIHFVENIILDNLKDYILLSGTII